MKKVYWVEFEVEGRGRFPMDMLRYDGCYPADGNSAFEISEAEQGFRAERWTVILRSHLPARGCPVPTVARWESFGCSVTRITRFDQDGCEIYKVWTMKEAS